MTEKWYDDTVSDEDRFYEEALGRIRSAVRSQKMTFEQAVSLVHTEDKELKAAILDDALKVLIADFHFTEGISIQELAKKLRLPASALNKARTEMLADVEDAAIEKYKEEQKQQGNA